VPLPATAPTGMIRRLGAARWRRLHRLVYAAAVAGCLHFIWLAKKVRPDPWVYAAILALLLGIRVWDSARRFARRRDHLLGSSAMDSTARLLVFLALLLTGCAGVTPRAPGPPGAAAPTRHVLPNGVVVISQEHRASDIVAVQLWLRVGGRDEAPAELGLSHYLEHMNPTQDDPERFLQRRLTEAAYPAHPYGRPLLGTREFVKNLTRETLNAYYKKHYVPVNMVLVVVGAVTPAQARDVAAETFGRLTGPAPVRPAVGPPTRRGAPQDVRRSERQAYLGIAWHAAPTGNTDIYAVDLLTYILGDGPSSRLNQVLREQRGLVQTIDASSIPRQLSGLVSAPAR